MTKTIKVIVRPHEPFILSVSRDLVSFGCLLSLFYVNHAYLGDHWAVHLFGGVLILVSIVGRSSVLETTGSAVFTETDEAINFLKKIGTAKERLK